MKTVYTNWNIVLCLAALIYRPLVPYAFINSCAIFTSFHAAMIVEPLAYRKLLRWNNVDPMVFWIGDFVVHGLPLGFYFYLKEPMRIDQGLSTLCLHLTWAFASYGSIFLDNAYIKASRNVWISLWLVTAATHLGVPFLDPSMTKSNLGPSVTKSSNLSL